MVPRVCGICGIASPAGADPIGRVAAMSATLVHRGPDSDGIVVDGPSASPRAGSRSSTSRPATSRSPTRTARSSSSRTARSTTTASCGASWRRRATASARSGDTEVLAHLYEEHGDGFAERLRGMFAVAIWDARRHRLVLARDRFGIKPLYYRADGDGWLEFASELRALPRGEVDLDALEAFLAFNSIPAPLDLPRDPQAAARAPARLGGRRAALERYARPAPAPAGDVRREPEDELAEELASGCATRCALTSSATCRSACCSPAASTRRCSPPSPREEARAGAHVHDRLRGALVRRDRRRAASSPSGTARDTTSSSSSRRGAPAARARGGLRRAVRRLVRAAHVPRLRARGARTSRSRSPARAATSSSAATTRTRPTCSRSGSAASPASPGRSSSGCRLEPRKRASTTALKRFVRARICRRSSGTTAGRRSSPPTRAPS